MNIAEDRRHDLHGGALAQDRLGHRPAGLGVPGRLRRRVLLHVRRRYASRFNDVASVRLLEPVNFFVLAGLYGITFLAVMLALLISVDTIAGEIASGTIQTIGDQTAAPLGGRGGQMAGARRSC